MKAFALAAGRKAATGIVAGLAASSTATAREVQPQTVPSSSVRKVEDADWLVTDVDEKEVFVFKPFAACEVDAAIEQVHAMMQPGRRAAAPSTSQVVIEVEPQSPPSETESVGGEADQYLSEPVAVRNSDGTGVEMTDIQHAGHEMHDFLKVAGKLLKRPGIQLEVFKCMLEDEEVRSVMLRQSRDIDAYLTAVGIHNPRLLQKPESESASESEGEAKPVLQNILEAVAACIDKTGSWLTGLGGWLLERISSLGTLLSRALRTDSGEDSSERSGEQHSRRTAELVLGTVMVVTAAVFCVLLARSPVLRTAAAGVAAAKFAQQAQKTSNAAKLP